MSSGKWRPSCLGLNVLSNVPNSDMTIWMAEDHPGLISKYHVKPVLMIPVRVPACQYVAAAMVEMIIRAPKCKDAVLSV